MLEAINWAWQQELATIGQKIVLLCLANRANTSGQCWPSVARICKDTGLSDKGVRKILKELCDQGLITSTNEQGKVSIYTVRYTVPTGTEYSPVLDDHYRGTNVPGSPVLDDSTPLQSPLNVMNLKETKENRKVRVRARSLEPVKISYGEFSNVKLTEQEYGKLVAEYGESDTLEAIKYLDLHIGGRKGGDPYKSHYMAMKKWVFNAVYEQQRRSGTIRASPVQQVKSWDDRVSDANIAAFLAAEEKRERQMAGGA